MLLPRWLRPAPAILLSAAVVLSGAPRAEAADPVEIHAILALTGSAAFLGSAERASLLAFEDATNKAGGIKGRPLKIVIEDDQTNPQVAVQLMNGILANKPSIVIDGGPATTCRATSALIGADGPLMYCFTPTVATTPGTYVFSSSYSTEAILGVALRYLRERGLKKIAILNGTDATGQIGDEVLLALIKDPANVRAGMTFVAHEHYNLTDVSVAAQLASVRAAGAQALIVFTTGSPIATVLHGIQNLALDIPVVVSPGNMNYAQMQSYKGFVPKELLFSGSPLFVPEQLSDGAVKSQVLAYAEALKPQGLRPDLLNSVAWDPMNLLVAALRKLGPGAPAPALKAEIAGLRNVPGVLGRYDFRATPQRGISADWVIVERWDPDKGAFVAVSKPGGTLR